MFIGLDLSGYGFTEESYRWSQYDYLEAQGSTLKEILNDAIVFSSDQDGEEVSQCEIGDTKYYNELESLLIFEYNKRNK